MHKLTALLLFSAAAAFAADVQAPTDAFPPGTKLMPARKVQLALDKDHYAEIDFPARPGVVDDLVNLIPGEKMLVEAEVDGSRLVKLHVVDAIAHPDRTLTLEFTQNPEREHPFMILSVQNPFSKKLRYAAGIQRRGQQGFSKTDVLDIEPKLSNFESWQEPLTRILLNHFELVDAKQ